VGNVLWRYNALINAVHIRASLAVGGAGSITASNANPPYLDTGGNLNDGTNYYTPKINSDFIGVVEATTQVLDDQSKDYLTKINCLIDTNGELWMRLIKPASGTTYTVTFNT